MPGNPLIWDFTAAERGRTDLSAQRTDVGRRGVPVDFSIRGRLHVSTTHRNPAPALRYCRKMIGDTSQRGEEIGWLLCSRACVRRRSLVKLIVKRGNTESGQEEKRAGLTIEGIYYLFIISLRWLYYWSPKLTAV